MYTAYFGLKTKPFNLSPDPAFFYRSRPHEEALANLIYGVQSRKGFIVLTGEVGTGKTTLLECLRDYLLYYRIEFAYVFNTRLTVAEFYEMIAYDLGLRLQKGSKTEILFLLNQFLLQQATRGSTTVLIVDEAQNLDTELLEEIRLLGNLESRQEKLLQIILAGQPELDRKLDAPHLRQLKQRIVLRCHLRPFYEEETIDYINSRMARAGLPDQQVFPLELMRQIHVRTRGIPRLINVVCDNLLLTAFALESRVATEEMLEEVCRDLALESPGRAQYEDALDYGRSTSYPTHYWSRE